MLLHTEQRRVTDYNKSKYSAGKQITICATKLALSNVTLVLEEIQSSEVKI